MTEENTLEALWQESFPGLATAAADPGLSYRPDSLSSTLTLSGEPSPEEAPPPASSSPELPDHRLLARIGEGGMGLVYRARQLSLQREVAVKTFKKRAGNDQARQAFLAEARVTAVLDHPNIVPVHELHEQGEELYLSMKLVGGQPWSERLAQDKPWANPDKLDEHLEVLLSVSNAVAFAHSRGIVHLDLKPDNVMLGEYGEVLVLDWGLARELEPGQGRAGLASDLKEPCGTPRYMAPELARGEGSELGPWTDVYLLGACLYEVLSGRPPHAGAGLFEVLRAAVSADAAAPEGAPRELSELAGRALAKAAEERPSSAEAFQASLRDYRRHRESARLSEAAWGDLEAAGTSSGRARYDALAGAIASFEQSLKLWGENKQAVEGRSAARRRYAEEALESGDLLLAETQIAALGACAAREELSGRLSAARSAEAARARRGRWQRRGLAAAALVIVGLTAGAFEINRRGRARERAERLKAEAAESAAQANALEAASAAAAALVSQAEAEKSAAEAERSAVEARRQEAAARAALARAERNLGEAYRQTGGYNLSRGDGILADVYLSRALVTEDHRRVREALLEARLSSPRLLWSRRVSAELTAAAFDRGDERLGLSWLEDGQQRLAIFDALSGEPAGSLATVSSRVGAFAFDSANRDQVFLAGLEGLERWSLSRGEMLKRWPYGGSLRRPSALVPGSKTGQILGLLPAAGVMVYDPADPRGLIGNAPIPGAHRLFAPSRFPGVFVSGEGITGRVNLETGLYQQVEILSGETRERVTARQYIAASADGDTFAAAYQTKVNLMRLTARDRFVKLGSFRISESRDAEMRGLEDSEDWIRGLSMSPDGRLVLAYSGQDQALRIWEARTREVLLRVPGRGRFVAFADFGRTGSSFFIVWHRFGEPDLELEVWTLGQRAITSPSTRGKAVALRPIPGSGELLVLYPDRLYRWSPEANRWSSLAELNEARAMAVSADGARVAVSEDDRVSLRAADSGALLGALPQEHAAYADRPLGLPADYREAMLKLLNRALGDSIKDELGKAKKALDAESREELEAALKKGILPPLDDPIYAQMKDETLAVARLIYAYHELDFDPTGAKLTAFGVGETHVYDLASGAIEARRSAEARDVLPFFGLRVALDPTGARFAHFRRGEAVLDKDDPRVKPGSLIIRQRSTGALIAEASAPVKRGLDLRFSPSGHELALLDRKGVLIFWSALGAPRLSIPLLMHIQSGGHRALPTTCAFITDALIATGDQLGRFCVWDTRTGALLGGFQAFPGAIRTLTRSPDGAHLFASDLTGAVRRWDARIIARALTATPAQLFDDAQQRTGLRLEGLDLVPAKD